MRLTGKQIEQLQQLLLQNYSSYAPLEQMVRFQLDVNLTAIVDGENLGDTVYKLVIWSMETGRLRELVNGAIERNPSEELVAFAKHLFHPVGDNSSESPESAIKSNIPPAPFLGPIPFHSAQASLFFGRDKVIQELLNRLVQAGSKIIVVNGQSGSGKTSILRAGLIPALAAGGYAASYCSVVDSPHLDAIQAISDTYPEILGGTHIHSLIDAANLVSNAIRKPLFLIVDQVERCFTATNDRAGRLDFWRSVAHLAERETRYPTTILLAVRSDWLHAFQDVSPMPLNANIWAALYQLKPLTISDAKEALGQPLHQFGIQFPAELVDRVIDDLAYDDEGVRYVNPPQLQIVGNALYKHLLERLGDESKRLTLNDYEQLRGTRTIIRNHLVTIVNFLGPQRQACWQILLQLVGSEGLRASRRLEELQGELSPMQFSAIMDHLVNNALVIREISHTNNSPVYTLTHDYLIEEINNYVELNPELQAWRTADHYLDIGLVDWRDSMQSKTAELLLDRPRYMYIWQNKDYFGSLSDEANYFLMHSALASGESSFGHWYTNLANSDTGASLETVTDYLFSSDASMRNGAMRATIAVISQNTLPKAELAKLKEIMWAKFQGIKASPETQSITEESTDRTLVYDKSGVTVRRQIAASVLWALRDFLNASELRHIAPTLATQWFVTHRSQFAISVVSILLATVLGSGFWFAVSQSRGAWVRLPTFHGGAVSDIAFSPADAQVIYAITPRGPDISDGATLLRRATNGEWQVMSTNITYREILDLESVGNTQSVRLFVSVSGKGILRSDDEGLTWREVNSGLRSYRIRSIVADPDNPDQIFAAADDRRGVFASENGGNTWSDISGEELFATSVFALAYSFQEGGKLIAGSQDGGILIRRRSDNEWEPVYAYPRLGTVVTFAVEPIEQRQIYAGTSNGRVLVSTDAGETWVLQPELPELFSVYTIAAIPGNPQHVWMNGFGIGGHLTRFSLDEGVSWQVAESAKVTRTGWKLHTSSLTPDTVYSTGSSGLFESRDQGRTWMHEWLPAPFAATYHIGINQSQNASLYVSSEGGMLIGDNVSMPAWYSSQELPAYIIGDIEVDPDSNNIAYVATHTPNKWSVFKTVDAGRTWRPTPPLTNIPERFFDHITDIDVVKIDGQSIIYAGTNGCGFIYSMDGGNHWRSQAQNECLLSNDEPRNILALSVSTTNAEKIYVAADSSRVYHTTDLGVTWTYSELPIGNIITDIQNDYGHDNKVYLIAGPDGFWRSEDSGQTWKDIADTFEGENLVQLERVPNETGHLFVAANSGRVWESFDEGESWKLIQENLNISGVSAMAYKLNSDTLIIGTPMEGIYLYQRGLLENFWR